MINAPEGSTIANSWGQKGLAFHSCATCGCTTHWSLLVDDSHQAVNMRLVKPEVRAALPCSQFDGAET